MSKQFSESKDQPSKKNFKKFVELILVLASQQKHINSSNVDQISN